MGKVKQEWETKSELALMGKFIPVESEDAVNFVTEYILQVLGKDEAPDCLFNSIYDELHRYSKKNEVKYIGCNTLQGMRCITYCIDTHDGETPEPFATDWGSGYPASFCYVYNVDAPDCSEFGDCFFEKRSDDYYHRVS